MVPWPVPWILDSRLFAQAQWLYLLRARLLVDSTPRTWLFQHSRAYAQWLSGDPHYLTTLKHHPYPSAPLDLSIFEPMSQEYQEASTQVASPALPQSRGAHILVGFVKHNKFELADRVRLELLEIGETIPPDSIYEEAAINVLRSPSSVKDPVAVFTNWFSLFPPATPKTREDNFFRIRSLLYYDMKVM